MKDFFVNDINNDRTHQFNGIAKLLFSVIRNCQVINTVPTNLTSDGYLLNPLA